VNGVLHRALTDFGNGVADGADCDRRHSNRNRDPDDQLLDIAAHDRLHPDATLQATARNGCDGHHKTEVFAIQKEGRADARGGCRFAKHDASSAHEPGRHSERVSKSSGIRAIAAGI
jgi:hypothetical protein